MSSRIDRLLSSQTAEGEAWDFKEKIYAASDRDVSEFLKDVTSFANAGGGTIVLGIRTDDAGRAHEAIGIASENLDGEIQRLEHLLRDLVEPDVTGSVKISDEIAESGRRCIFIDVEESALAPHRVTQKGKYRSFFFVRRGRRSEEADVPALRTLFEGRQRIAEMFKGFVDERTSSLRSGQYLHGQQGIPQALIHVSPRRSFGSRRLVDWMLQSDNRFRLSPRANDGYQARPNLYGAINVSDDVLNPYNQAFYNGAVEMLRQAFTASRVDANSGIHAPTLADFFMDDLTRVLRVVHEVFAEDSYLIGINFLNVPRTELVAYRGHYATRLANSIPAATNFSLPIMVVRTASAEVFLEDMKTILDLVWRAWGQVQFEPQLNLRWSP